MSRTRTYRRTSNMLEYFGSDARGGLKAVFFLVSNVGERP